MNSCTDAIVKLHEHLDKYIFVAASYQFKIMMLYTP